MSIERLDHYTIVTQDLEQSIGFYCDVIGLSNGARPPFKFPGAWLYCDERAVLHLIASDKDRPNAGRLDHAALKATGYDEMIGRLENHGSSYEENNLPGADVRQVFVTTPEGEKLELIFDLAEVPDDRKTQVSR